MHRSGLMSIFLSSTPKSDNRLPFYAGGRAGRSGKSILPFSDFSFYGGISNHFGGQKSSALVQQRQRRDSRQWQAA